jgi:hypothetical protein
MRRSCSARRSTSCSRGSSNKTPSPCVSPGKAAAAAAGITVLLWASAFVGIRSAGNWFGPGELALARLVVATAALAAAAARLRPAVVRRLQPRVERG